MTPTAALMTGVLTGALLGVGLMCLLMAGGRGGVARVSAIDQDFVRDLIERHSDASGGNGRDFHNGAYAAIADELNATLGSCNCSNDCTNGERTDVPRLPHFWTHDGTLHVELPKLPESISVRLPDQRDREVRSARTWQYMRGNDGVGRTNDGLADLQAENAKLRELMSVMAYCSQFMRDCDGCSMNGAAGIITERVGCDELLARLRELGVEVDG